MEDKEKHLLIRLEQEVKTKEDESFRNNGERLGKEMDRRMDDIDEYKDTLDDLDSDNSIEIATYDKGYFAGYRECLQKVKEFFQNKARFKILRAFAVRSEEPNEPGKLYYDIRHKDNDWTEPESIEPFVYRSSASIWKKSGIIS